ncbi:MAG TPA: transcriptional repressor LexA [Verrucomicrobiota bacterium]|nr:repressor LexA [Verrucomicrobiales bacterium]HRI12455.1 transcriptional repressor LexA [Verrucomicrobiota bacterium]
MVALTTIQQRVFDFVRDKAINGDPAPTVREIAAEFGWRSKRAAAFHLEALIRKGWLSSERGKVRSLRLIHPPTRMRHPVVEIPLLGSIPAGPSAEREAGQEECVPVAIDSLGFKPTRNTFALRVVGDSMIGRHICDGDIAILEHGGDPRHGQVVAALIDRKNTLKTFLVKGGKPYLRAENPKYPDLIPSEELVIQGVLRMVIRQIPR